MFSYKIIPLLCFNILAFASVSIHKHAKGNDSYKLVILTSRLSAFVLH